MKKIISLLILNIVLLTSVFSGTAFANTNDLVNQTNIEIALEQKLSYEFGEYTPEKFNDWIELYNREKIRYAYLVALYDSKGSVAGFSIVSDINNRVLMTAVGTERVEFLKKIYELEKTKDVKSILIYEFPNGFYIIEEKDKITQVFMNGEIIEVEEIFDNEIDEVGFLKMHPNNSKLRSSTVYGSLDDWDESEFVPVPLVGGGYSYGGHQNWLTNEGVSTLYANRSCGVTAASNMMQYMSEHVSGKSNLYTQSTMYGFSDYQKDVYDYLDPAIYGIPGINTMIDRVKAFATSEGVDLDEVLSNETWNETNVRNYIASGLNSENPVLLITWDSIIPDLETHWVTVTKLYGSYGDTTMVTSNWAEKEEYDFSLWVSAGSMYGGVIYFE